MMCIVRTDSFLKVLDPVVLIFYLKVKYISRPNNCTENPEKKLS